MAYPLVLDGIIERIDIYSAFLQFCLELARIPFERAIVAVADKSGGEIRRKPVDDRCLRSLGRVSPAANTKVGPTELPD